MYLHGDNAEQTVYRLLVPAESKETDRGTCSDNTQKMPQDMADVRTYTGGTVHMYGSGHRLGCCNTNTACPRMPIKELVQMSNLCCIC